jgi:hypothetical protein
LPFLKEVVNSSNNQTGTLLCNVYTNSSNPSRLFTLEACTGKEYLLDVYSQSQADFNSENSLGFRNGTEFMYLEMKVGFLYREIDPQTWNCSRFRFIVDIQVIVDR